MGYNLDMNKHFIFRGKELPFEKHELDWTADYGYLLKHIKETEDFYKSLDEELYGSLEFLSCNTSKEYDDFTDDFILLKDSVKDYLLKIELLQYQMEMSEGKCPYCDGYMSWCSCCEMWSSDCCEDYGTCQCS